MAGKENGRSSYPQIKAEIESGNIGRFYIFHGDERYLLERSLGMLREALCPGDAGGFNHKRFDGAELTPATLSVAVDTMPIFAERTLVEIHDFNVFKDDKKESYRDIIKDLPQYVCLLLVFDTVVFKPDGRVKLDSEIAGSATIVEFAVQEHAKLGKWIAGHFSSHGKTISGADAEYLCMLTGGYMTALNGEIGKIAAYSKGSAVTRSDIDAVVVPVLDAVVYKLSDALGSLDHAKAFRICDELLQMQEPAHKLLYHISMRMRQLLAARVCLDSGVSRKEFMDLCAIRYDFAATSVLNAARGMSLAQCRESVLLCAQTAMDLNSAPDPESSLVMLIAKLAYSRNAGSR